MLHVVFWWALVLDFFAILAGLFWPGGAPLFLLPIVMLFTSLALWAGVFLWLPRARHGRSSGSYPS